MNQIISKDEITISKTRLGEGLFGITYEGDCRGEKIAVKKINEHVFSGKEELENDSFMTIQHQNLLIYMVLKFFFFL